ncbi:DNA cytosine methyltransferase [Mesobacillus stamsii]|uniref:DNA (cytosine-5-)-methyltransferase n=1 Tax=Mesobacillus stamsii TaxID=225347 RepID=A0ABU0FS10_9BACI|nr:DNA cytosine methyltransferase [Mesobacillus stamsii]MDQ0412702.1 DNA (cytosine-5)-methyltransferase 1 [Mesobacillus stamsii]
MKQLDLFREIIVDNFAGGGGASTGIEMATGLSVDIAINHDPAAIAMHKANHPDTEHYCESVWEVDPREAVKGRPVGLAWFSPDCKHFSKAKGGKPVNKEIRGLAWVAVRWAATVKPRVIMLENVEEFKTWGPIGKDGQPIKEKQGITFKRFVKSLNKLGYKVDFKELSACDFGAPTTRKRFFMIARCDGRPILWPEPTHGHPESLRVQLGKSKPWRTASEIIDWSIGTPSIFTRKKPLAENTLKRIARGMKKFVIENPDPYIAPIKPSDEGNSNRVAAFLTSYYTEQKDEVRGLSLNSPLHTITTSNRFALVTAFLTKYYGAGIGQELTSPVHTIPTRDRFGLVTVQSQNYRVTDIGMRMLQPHELYEGQGFPEIYIIDRDDLGKPYPKKEQVARCGNSVPPNLPDALVRVNLPEFCVKENRYKKTVAN